MDKELFAEIMSGLAANFGDTLNPALLKMWEKLFSQDKITIEQIQAAAVKILRTRKYKSMPTYAEFLDAINGTPKNNAEIQVDIVLDSLKKIGSLGEPIFMDPITNRLMHTRWPWKAWASSILTNEVKWWRREFIEAYLSYSESGIKPCDQISFGGAVSRLTKNIGGHNGKEKEKIPS